MIFFNFFLIQLLHKNEPYGTISVMMEKRSYKKYTDVYQELETFCIQSLKDGSFLLPGERELASRFHVSRLTLRKAIEDAQMNGLIRREGKRTEILPYRALKRCGRIVFFTPGMHSSFFLPAFERLWLTLRPQVENCGGVMELYLDHDERGFPSFCRAADFADVILVTVFTSADREKKLGYLSRLQGRKTVVALSDPYLEDFTNAVALDNHAVGEEAAGALLAAGCRRAAVADVPYGMNMFWKRYEGFRRRFLAGGGGEVKLFPRRPAAEGARELLQIYRDGFDCAFVVTDENMRERMSLVLEEGIVPDRFKLISFNGSGEGIRCMPPVTCINQGTSEIVTEILQYLKLLARSGYGEKIRKLIRPHLYLNKTIGRIDDSIFNRREKIQ